MKIKSILAVTALSLALVGCSKVNKENYDKVKVGMDYSEVIEVVGDPDKCKETLGTKSCVWGDDSKNIKVSFVADKVLLPSSNGL
jgi:hypothetical protein